MTQLKVFRATSYGLDETYFIVAAVDCEEAEQLVLNEGFANVEVMDCPDLQTTLTVSCIVERF